MTSLIISCNRNCSYALYLGGKQCLKTFLFSVGCNVMYQGCNPNSYKKIYRQWLTNVIIIKFSNILTKISKNSYRILILFLVDFIWTLHREAGGAILLSILLFLFIIRNIPEHRKRCIIRPS